MATPGVAASPREYWHHIQLEAGGPPHRGVGHHDRYTAGYSSIAQLDIHSAVGNCRNRRTLQVGNFGIRNAPLALSRNILCHAVGPNYLNDDLLPGFRGGKPDSRRVAGEGISRSRSSKSDE